jgi:hypothetical protein
MTLADDAITAAKIAADAIGASELAADAVAEIQSGLATAAALAVVDTVVDAILADTGTDGVVVTSHTTAAKAEVQTEAEDALAAYDPPTKAEMDAGHALLATAANLTTLINQVGAFTGSGVNTVLGLLKAVMSKAASTPSDVGGTFSAATDSLEAIRDQGDAAWGPGGGPITFTYTLTSSVDGSPIADCWVGVYTEAGMTNLVASGRTDNSGVVTFYLDAGTYYLKREKSGWNFTNPDTEVVS